MTRLEEIRTLIHSIVNQISNNYDALKVAKKVKASQDVIKSINEAINQLKSSLNELREMYNNLRREAPRREEEDEEEEEAIESIRHLYELYPYYETRSIFPDSIAMYVIDMESSTGRYSLDVRKLEEPLKAVLKEAFNTYGPFKFLWRMNITVGYSDGREDNISYFQPRSLPYTVLNPQEIN